MRILLLLAIFPNLLFSQKDIQQEKYWIYRERVKNFVVSGKCTGCGIPANGRDYTNQLAYADPSYALGWWIGTLAMEYDLLNRTCAHGSTDACNYLIQTKQDLFYAIEAINQMDYDAEKAWGCTPALNGFLLRDNVHNDKNDPNYFGTQMVDGESVNDHLNDSWIPIPDGFRAECFNSAYASHVNGRSEASIDHLIALYTGLVLTKKVFENLPTESCSGCGKFKDGQTSFLIEVQNISDRIITWLSSHSWIYVNGCNPLPVQGVTADAYVNPCVNLTDIGHTKCTGTLDCLDKGGAHGVPSAIGFAAANKYIQTGSSREISADILFAALRANPLYYDEWVAAISSLKPKSKQSDLPVTLATLGNFWHRNNSTNEVAAKIKKESVDHDWQQYILLHRYIYGDQLDKKNHLITIPYKYYDCMLNVAPCRGFDGTDITGGNVEWGCQKRLIGDRAGSECHDCEGVEKIKVEPHTVIIKCNTSSANDGMPGWELGSINRIDFMFYYNLFNLVEPAYPYPVYYTPIPIKELALTDIVKPDQYLNSPTSHVEYDKKNFMAANTITATSYSIDVDPSGQGRVTFVAGKHVDLLPGFEVKNGGTLKAYIDNSIKAADCLSLTNPYTSASDALDLTDCSGDLEKLMAETEQDTLNEDEDLNSDSYMQIIPNPSTGKIMLQFSDYPFMRMVGDKKTVSIYSVFGEKLSQEEFTGSQYEMDLSSVPKGVYFIQVHSLDKTFNDRVIIQ